MSKKIVPSHPQPPHPNSCISVTCRAKLEGRAVRSQMFGAARSRLSSWLLEKAQELWVLNCDREGQLS